MLDEKTLSARYAPAGLTPTQLELLAAFRSMGFKKVDPDLFK